MMTKRNIFTLLLLICTISLSAQKAERQAVRSGNKSYKEQLYGTAEAEYHKALEVNAGSKEASYNLANTYYKQQRWDDALKEYEHYLTLETQDPMKMSGAWGNVGNAYLKRKDGERAQNQMQAQAGQIQAGQPQAKEGPDNLQLSMEAYKNALRLNPNDDEIRYNLAVVQKMIADNKDGGGGGDDKQDEDKKDEDKKDEEKKEDQKDQNQDNKDQKDDKKDDKQQQQNQMSQDNIDQILKAIEQDEKETQERVKETQAQERKKQSLRNKQQDKDW